MKCLLLEDDCLQSQGIIRILEKSFSDMEIFVCSNIDDAIESLSVHSFDVFLLDICLSMQDVHYSGIYFAKTIRSINKYFNTPILFITSVPDKIDVCLNDLHCYSYLIKPFNEQALIKSVRDIIRVNSTDAASDFILVKLLNSVSTRISYSDILYIEVNGHNIHFVCFEKEYKTKNVPLSTLTHSLPPYFIQCHKKYMINMNYMTFYDKSNFYISLGKTVLPVGRSYKPLLDNYFRTHLL